MSPASLLTLWLSTISLPHLIDEVKELVEPGDTEADIKALCRSVIDAALPEELLPVWGAQAQDVIDAAGDRAGAWLYKRFTAPKRRVGGKLAAPLRKALEGLRAAFQARGEAVPANIESALAGS